MLKLITNTFSILLFCMFALSGCFFNDTPEADNESTFIVERLEDSCEIDSDKLAKILTEDVTAEIECVGAKLNQFAKYVRRTDSRYINKDEISRFITKFFPEDAPKLNQSIDMLFDISNLILEDKKQVISLENIQPLILLFKAFNREALFIHKLVNDDTTNGKAADICQSNPTDNCYEIFMMKRSRYKNAVDRLSRYVTNLLRGKKKNIDTLEIVKFLEKANTAFKDDPSEDDLIDIKTAESFLFIKRIFLGGNKKTIQTNEVHDLLRKLPDFSLLLFDIRYGTTEVFESQPNEQVYLFANHMDSLQKRVYPYFNRDEIIFTTQELIDALNSLVTVTEDDEESVLSEKLQNLDFNTFKSVFEMVKGKILGGEALFYTSHDIQNILSLSQEVLEGIYFNSIVYDYYQVRMEDTSPISEIILPSLDDIPQMRSIRSNQIDHYWDLFSHIAKRYHYYSDSDSHIQNFQQEIIRTKYGFNEIYLLRWFSDRLLRAFGSVEPNANGDYYGTQEQVEEALIALKPLLMEFNFWPKKFETFAYNMVTLADLFQTQSNGDMHIGLDEMTEYFELVLTTVSIQTDVQEGMKQYCEQVLNSDDSEDDSIIFDPECYRNYFFTVFFEDLHLENKFPMLYLYYKESSRHELAQFHKYVEEFARDDMNHLDGSPVMMYDRDRTLTIGALLNIESAYVAFDHRRIDNRMTYGELEDAYRLFRNVIIVLGEMDSGEEKYARAVFYFLVDKLKEPTTLEVLRYHYLADLEDITAYRMNIAAILSYFKIKSLEQIEE